MENTQDKNAADTNQKTAGIETETLAAASAASATETKATTGTKPKKPYTPPKFSCYGTLADMTKMARGRTGQPDGGGRVGHRRTGA